MARYQGTARLTIEGIKGAAPRPTVVRVRALYLNLHSSSTLEYATRELSALEGGGKRRGKMKVQPAAIPGQCPNDPGLGKPSASNVNGDQSDNDYEKEFPGRGWQVHDLRPCC